MTLEALGSLLNYSVSIALIPSFHQPPDENRDHSLGITSMPGLIQKGEGRKGLVFFPSESLETFMAESLVPKRSISTSLNSQLLV